MAMTAFAAFAHKTAQTRKTYANEHSYSERSLNITHGSNILWLLIFIHQQVKTHCHLFLMFLLYPQNAKLLLL